MRPVSAACDTKLMRPGHGDHREEFISWREMWERMYPMEGLSSEDNVPSGYYDAAEMNRLRGVAIVQAAETEAVIAEILCLLDSSADVARSAGTLLADVKKRLDAHTLDRWSWALDSIGEAIGRRNRLV